MSHLIIATVLYIAIIAIASDSSSVIPSFGDEVIELEPVTRKAITSETATSNLYLFPPVELESLSIRELKKLASNAKIKRYSTLNKRQLISALAA